MNCLLQFSSYHLPSCSRKLILPFNISCGYKSTIYCNKTLFCNKLFRPRFEGLCILLNHLRQFFNFWELPQCGNRRPRFLPTLRRKHMVRNRNSLHPRCPQLLYDSPFFLKPLLPIFFRRVFHSLNMFNPRKPLLGNLVPLLLRLRRKLLPFRRYS